MDKETRKAWRYYKKSFIDKTTGYYKYLQIKNDECKIYRTRTELIIVFAGSNDIKDWINNLDTKSSENFEFHYGFKQSAERFIEQLKEIILDNSSLKITLIGFSRGGAFTAQPGSVSGSSRRRGAGVRGAGRSGQGADSKSA